QFPKFKDIDNINARDSKDEIENSYTNMYCIILSLKLSKDVSNFASSQL
ncbi:4911_t:CDS:2, partial [Dentiscutata heterogama]